MAIYSLNHTSIGKRTQARACTAGAHVRYITRASAATEVLHHGMTDRPDYWLDTMEPVLRVDARTLDKIRVALPDELSGEQRRELALDFTRQLCTGADGASASWLLALHSPSDDGDERNHHFHLAVADRHPVTGKRVAGLSMRGSTERVRALWETVCNDHLERADVEARVDRRSLAAQDANRVATGELAAARLPGLHVGPTATALARAGRQPGAARAVERKSIDGRTRTVDYTAYYETRSDENAWRLDVRARAKAEAAAKVREAADQARRDVEEAARAEEARQEAIRQAQAQTAAAAAREAQKARQEAAEAAQTAAARSAGLAAVLAQRARQTAPRPRPVLDVPASVDDHAPRALAAGVAQPAPTAAPAPSPTSPPDVGEPLAAEGNPAPRAPSASVAPPGATPPVSPLDSPRHRAIWWAHWLVAITEPRLTPAQRSATAGAIVQDWRRRRPDAPDKAERQTVIDWATTLGRTALRAAIEPLARLPRGPAPSRAVNPPTAGPPLRSGRDVPSR